MKTKIICFYGFLAILYVFAITSCETTTNDKIAKGRAEFSLSMPEETMKSLAGASSDSGIASYHILVSIEDLAGKAVITDSLIPVYAFGTGFTSEDVELQTGDYNLTKFLVINPSGAVMYAAPLEGSPLAYLVNDPLPISFTIHVDQVTNIVPEVLLVGDQPPGQFGYASFGMQVIKPLHFWTVCILDCPMCMSPTLLTTAKLTVYADNGWHYTFGLEAAVNHLIIKGGSDIYYFLLEKEGYQPQTLKFNARELAATSKENPLVLKIPWDSNQWKTLELQPGPDDGKDAMISNLESDKNFGDHKYFEATFLTEPILTVMRSNRSLIWFNLNSLPKSSVIKKVTLQLFYDIPIPWDPAVFASVPVTSSDWVGGVLQQVVEPWEEYNVTWNNQPKTIEANQVFISPFNINANIITVDVTTLFVPINGTAAENYGMLFRLWPSEQFPGFRFASSDYSVASMRPKLTVYYTIN
jgi:hypothetical protein